MGADGSKMSIDASDPQQVLFVQQLANLVKSIEEQDEANKRQRQVLIGQIFQMMLAFIQMSANETVIRPENKEITIEGVTCQIVQFVNRGSFGNVYKAKLKGTDKLIAVKVMQNLPGLQKAIHNEIQFLRVIKEIPIENHPIIEYYASELTKEGVYIAMELAESTLLAFWSNIIENGDPKEIVLYSVIVMIYVLRALAFLEKLNIIHGDIKPQNLVIVATKTGFCIKLIDFGTAEKMSTQCIQMTVDGSAAYTSYFVSPEFLRRNKNNVIARHLHKKSDAWAAGVMFYVLFFQKLPWNNEADYQKFCDDPNAEDIVVPDVAGFKTIIELLLKKNPDARSSATATLMQLKDHPLFENLVKTLNQSFCPVDDVFHMTVPDDVRQDLLKLRRSGHVTSTDSKTPTSIKITSEQRPSCRYGQKCYNQDVDHRRQLAHPSDADDRTIEKSSHSKSEKLLCRYGANCYSKNEEHLKKYMHSNSSPTPSKQQTCRYGAACYNRDADHRKNFIHPSGTDEKPMGKPKCRYGDTCNMKSNQNHLKAFSHS